MAEKKKRGLEIERFFHIDYEEASKDAVSEDGIGHFLSSYDGEVHETNGNEYLIRIN
jgi:hypothetical protein